MRSPFTCIYREIWNDEKFCSLGDAGRQVYFYCLTTTFGNGLGCFKAGMAAMTEESLMSPKRFAKGFRECLHNELFEYDEHSRVIFIPTYFERNPPANPNGIKAMSKEFVRIPSCEMKWKCYRLVRQWCMARKESFLQTFTELFAEPPSNGSRIVSNVDKETVSGTVSETVKGTVPLTVSGTTRNVLPATCYQLPTTNSKKTGGGEARAKKKQKTRTKTEDEDKEGRQTVLEAVRPDRKDIPPPPRDEKVVVGDVSEILKSRKGKENARESLAARMVDDFPLVNIGGWKKLLQLDEDFSLKDWGTVLSKARYDLSDNAAEQEVRRVLERKVAWVQAKKQNKSTRAESGIPIGKRPRRKDPDEFVMPEDESALSNGW